MAAAVPTRTTRRSAAPSRSSASTAKSPRGSDCRERCRIREIGRTRKFGLPALLGPGLLLLRLRGRGLRAVLVVRRRTRHAGMRRPDPVLRCRLRRHLASLRRMPGHRPRIKAGDVVTGYLWRGQPGWDPAKIIILPEDIPEPGVQFTKYQNKPHPRERCGACGHRG